VRRGRLATIAMAGTAFFGWAVPAWASTWAINVTSASQVAEAKAQAQPAAPVSVSASCVALQTKVTVAWGGVTAATSYSVYESNTSSSTGFALAASGLTTTSWTSTSLTAGSYWFTVVAYQGSNWASAMSLPAGPRTISLGLLCT
jgi:hypothetical protein